MFAPIMTVLNALAAYIAAHPFEVIIFGFAWALLSAITSGIPTPRPEGPIWYKIVFSSLHWLSLNPGRVEGVRELAAKFLKLGS